MSSAFLSLSCLFGAFAASLSAQATDVAIGTQAVQKSVNRMGMNLGQILPYGSKQLYKNLFASNPGFSNTQYQSVIYCSSGTTSSLCVSGTYADFPNGFWPADGSVSIRVMTGAAAGCTTTLKSWSNSQYGFASSCNIAAGDYISVKKIITSGAAGFNPTYGWNSSGSTLSTFTVSSDAPPASNGTTYTQSLQITTPTATDYASLVGTADYAYIPWTGSTQSFINLDGSFTVSYWAKAATGSNPSVSINLARGSKYYLKGVQDTLNSSWTHYAHTFTAAETGPQTDSLTLTFSVPGSESILLDKMNVSEVATSGNPTVFRDAVVSTLQALKPGVLRMSDLEGLTNSFSNMMVDQWARMPVNFFTSPLNGAPGYYNTISYSIPEFLQLCQAIGSEAWITVPVTFTPAESSELIDYLSGPATTTGGALRAAQGFSQPWTSVIPKIHLELGNEEWNGGTFDGGSMDIDYATYGTHAQSLFASMKSNPNYVQAATSLVLNAQFVNSYTLQLVQNACNNNDEIDIAPYMDFTLTDSSSIANIWQPGFAEPQVFWQAGAASGPSMVCAEYASGSLCPSAGYFNIGGTGQLVYGGAMYLDALAEANSTHPVTVSIYEENNSPRQGDFTQAQLDGYASAWGAGLEQASQFLTNMQHGILTQNLYELAGYYTTPAVSPNPAGADHLFLWGSVVDIGGPTNLRRPQFIVEQLINSGVTPGATMLATSQTGTPIFSVGSPATYPATNSVINTVAASAVNTIQSFAFNNGSGGYSLFLLNLDVASSHSVTFSGSNAPAGLVTLTTLTSQNLSDNNETQALIAPLTSSLSSPSGMTLAPYSMYLLTWSTVAKSSSPVISNVTATSTSPTTATVTWNTDQAATSTVNYGTTLAYGSSSALGSSLATSHSVSLTGLTAGTTYNFDVASSNASNVSSTSANYMFATATTAPVSNAPNISYVSCWGITFTGATITWSTNIPATSQLLWGTTSALGQTTLLQTALTSSHGVVLTGLASGTTYYFMPQSSAGGATSSSTVYSVTTGGVAPSTTPLVISNVSAVNIAANSATVTWITNVPSTSQVNFGTTPGYGSSVSEPALALAHALTLTGLSPGSTYNFSVVSANASNVSATSQNQTFTTPAPAVDAPVVGYIVSWGISGSGATITWSTSVPSNTQLVYGTTPQLGLITPLQTSMTSSHGVTLTGLASNTLYYFVVQSTAPDGGTGYSTVQTLTTY